MSDSTEAARDLLEAATVERTCGHVSWVLTCKSCERTAVPLMKLRALGFTPDTLRVAIGLAEAVEGQRSPGGHMPSCIAVGGKAGCVPKCLDATTALAAWEALLRPANGGEEEG